MRREWVKGEDIKGGIEGEEVWGGGGGGGG